MRTAVKSISIRNRKEIFLEMYNHIINSNFTILMSSWWLNIIEKYILLIIIL